MDKVEYSYQEVEQLLYNSDTKNMIFEEDQKYIHVAMAYTGDIRWAWGSGSYYKDISCFSDKQIEFLKNAKFKHSPMGL